MAAKKKKKAAVSDPPPPPYVYHYPHNARPPTATRGAPGVDFARLTWGEYEERQAHEIVIKLQGVKAGNIYHDRIRVEPAETAWHVKVRRGVGGGRADETAVLVQVLRVRHGRPPRRV